MALKKEFIGAFELEAQVFNKIGELKEKGYREEDLVVVSNDAHPVGVLQDKTAVRFETDVPNDGQHYEEGKILLFAQGGGLGASSGFGTGDSYAGTAAGRTGDATEEEHLRLHEERLQVDKHKVQTGEVNVGKHVVEEDVSVAVPVEHDEVVIERRPVNEEVSGITGTDAYEGEETIHVPLTEERVEVSKDDVVSEEVVVGKRKVQDVERVSETVSREEADIEEILDEDDPTGGRTGR